MKKVSIDTKVKKIPADIFTPVGIYLRLRDRFRDTILLESTDHHAAENSYSFICINAIAGIEIQAGNVVEFKLPAQSPERITMKDKREAPQLLSNFMHRFAPTTATQKEASFAQGLYGYTTYEAVQYFDTLHFAEKPAVKGIGILRYRLYQYVIAMDHFKNELHLCENIIDGVESDVNMVESLIRSKDVPEFPFAMKGEETSNMSNEDYKAMVQKGIKGCMRGDVFQVVLSRRFEQKFIGDEFNVYRALRSVNPSPYLFYFDYGDYRLFGSSPESQVIIKNGKAIVHPIAGTFKRTGDDATDKAATERLVNDPKENAEHVMLVDLARNDLSQLCNEVEVSQYKKVQYYSHVIHLVSEVTGNVQANADSFHVLSKTFPAGTLSGAPKFKAMQLIDEYEPTARGYYGGCIGFMGFDGSCNQAITIRTFLSKNNTLYYQAGAGVVAASNPESELQEVNNKLGALKKAIVLAEELF
jgi:anthranilate synthase component 1